MGRLQILAAEGTSPLFEVAPEPFGVVTSPDGGVVFCDVSNHSIFWIDPASGDTRVVAGTGLPGNDGDGGPARDARLIEPYEVRFDADGHLFFVDMMAHVVRRIDARTGIITTVAGSGVEGFGGDGGPATAAHLAKPHSIELHDRHLFIADIGNHRVRVVALETGTITTLLGTGAQGATVTDAGLHDVAVNGPRAIAFSADDSMVLALREGNALYRVDPTRQSISHIAGSGDFGYRGDGANARQAHLAGPKGIALTARGDIVLADTESHTIRSIGPDDIIRTIAGNGSPGDSLDPTESCLNRPHGVFVETQGTVLVGDSDNRRVVRL